MLNLLKEKGVKMFAERLKFLRQRGKITQQTLAKSLNVSTGTIAMWETGQRQPTVKKLNAIADFFDVPVSFLISDNFILDDKYSREKVQNKENTIVFFGRGEGRKEFKVSEEEMKHWLAIFESRQKNSTDDDF